MLVPGFILTGFAEGKPEAEALSKRFSAVTPLGRPGHIADMEGPAVYLASDASLFQTGTLLTVDGGRSVTAAACLVGRSSTGAWPSERGPFQARGLYPVHSLHARANKPPESDPRHLPASDHLALTGPSASERYFAARVSADRGDGFDRMIALQSCLGLPSSLSRHLGLMLSNRCRAMLCWACSHFFLSTRTSRMRQHEAEFPAARC